MRDVQVFNKLLKGKNPEDVLRWSIHKFGIDKVSLSSSLGASDQVLTDMLLKINPRASIFTLDTGRLHQETYDCMQETMDKYKFHYKVYQPETTALERLVADHGPNLFYHGLKKRKLCCSVRKVGPLQRALKGKKAWICGLQREQSMTRANLRVVEWDFLNGLYKINPLIEWTEKKIWNYIKTNHVPYNRLHDQSYPSIGCSPCTRAVKPGEGVRAGRWWWESSNKKECGLHDTDRKPKPRK